MRVVNKKIILKDGSILQGDPKQSTRIRVGAILRFRRGGSALMRIHSVWEDNHGFRLEGMNIIGDLHSAYAHDCVFPTEDDLTLWSAYSRDRSGSFLVKESIKKGL